MNGTILGWRPTGVLTKTLSSPSTVTLAMEPGLNYILSLSGRNRHSTVPGHPQEWSKAYDRVLERWRSSISDTVGIMHHPDVPNSYRVGDEESHLAQQFSGSQLLRVGVGTSIL